MTRLTVAELEAVLAVAGNAQPRETFEDGTDDEVALDHQVAAYESGMNGYAEFCVELCVDT